MEAATTIVISRQDERTCGLYCTDSKSFWMFIFLLAMRIYYPISAKANCSAHFSALANEKYRTGISYCLASVMIL